MANPFSITPANPLQALMAGQQGFTQAREFGKSSARDEAAQAYMQGDKQGALARLLQIGDVQGAQTLSNLGNNERDFAFRQEEAKRAQANTEASRALQERQMGQSSSQFQQSLALQRAQLQATLDGQKVPAGFQRTETGLRPVQGGPQDPNYIRETREGPKLSVSDISKLSEEGGKFANLTGFTDTFKDEYAGKPFGTGEASNYLARNLPSGMTGENERNAAGWWQGYDRFKNVVRNDLFGSALTANEQAAFDKADISPSMNPELIRRNLKIQKDLYEKGIKRKVDALTAQGYKPDVISKAYGINAQPAQQARSTPSSANPPRRISSPEEYATLQSGDTYIAPDGSVRTKQ